MKKLKRRVAFLFVLLAALAYGSRSVFAVPIVSIQPPFSSLTVGTFFHVFVDISSVTDLFAFQFDINFDPSVLSAVSVTEGAFLPTGGTTSFVPGIIDNLGGTISFSADALIGSIPGVNGTGTLAAIGFQALAANSSVVDLSGVVLLDSGLTDIPSDSAAGVVNVTAGAASVPEPSSLLLIGIGVFGLAVLRRRESRIADSSVVRLPMHSAFFPRAAGTGTHHLRNIRLERKGSKRE